MSEQKPLTPKDRATRRMMAAWDLDRAEAEHAVSHTTTGSFVLLEEQLKGLGRALARPPSWLARRPWGRTAWLLALGAYLGIGAAILLAWLAER